jgi:predicted TIM-barrel fold metal-dependent hydrolase
MIDFRIRPPMRDAASDPPVVLADHMGRYDELYEMESRSNVTLEELTGEMSRFGCVGLLQAEHEAGSSRDVNLRVAELVKRHPELFLGGIASVDPRAPGALDELEWAHDELGLRGMVIQPGFLQVEATDPRCRPLYEYCARRDVPVTVHTGINFSRSGSIEFGRPLAVGRVACEFPDLVLVCNHGGWPWVMESIALAWKHSNVYLEFGAIAPKYMAHPSGGWQPLPHWMNTQIRDKVLLATDWPMLRYDRLTEELPLLELRPDALAAYVRDNARRLIDRVWG